MRRTYAFVSCSFFIDCSIIARLRSGYGGLGTVTAVSVPNPHVLYPLIHESAFLGNSGLGSRSELEFQISDSVRPIELNSQLYL